METSNSPGSSREKLQYDSVQDDEEYDFNDSVHRKPRNSWHLPIISFLSVICLCLTAIIISRYHSKSNSRSCNCLMNDVGSNLLVNDDLSIINKVARPYHYLEHKFDLEDFGEADTFWDDMFPVGGGLVFLTQEYIESRRLPMSAISPLREGNRSVYEIAGYHSLHCVSALRANLWRAKNAMNGGEPYDINEYWLHTRHCLADLRQYIMCNFDETLLRVRDLIHHPGEEQLKLCTQTDPIDRWLEENFGPVE